MAKFKAGDKINDSSYFGKKHNAVGLTVIRVGDIADGIHYSCNDAEGKRYGWVEEESATEYVDRGTQEVRREAGHPRFLALCDEMKAVHQKKGADYGSDQDIFENIRRSERIGIPASKGCWMRASDKVGRLDKFFSGKALLNESAFDSLLDLANYCLIAACLLEEEAKKGQPADGKN